MKSSTPAIVRLGALGALVVLSACSGKTAREQGAELAGKKIDIVAGVGDQLQAKGAEAGESLTAGVGKVVKGIERGVLKSGRNVALDPAVAQAAEMAGLPGNAVLRTFPREITLWIDPEEVSYRFGENGSVSVLYDATHSEPWRPNLNAMVNANVHSVDNANANVRRNAQKKTTEEQVRPFATSES